jgi:hypothetical protein
MEEDPPEAFENGMWKRTSVSVPVLSSEIKTEG